MMLYRPYFCILASFLIVSGCRKSDDEAEIRHLIEKATVLAEQHNLRELMALATKGFIAHPGSRERREVNLLLMMTFRQYGEFSIVHPRYDVNLSGQGAEASVQLPFLIVRKGREIPGIRELVGDPAGWLEKAGEVADPYYMVLTLIKEGSVWRVDSATLRGFSRLIE